MRPQESAEDERMQQARIKTTTIWLASHDIRLQQTICPDFS